VTFAVVRTDGIVKALPDEGRSVTVVTDDRGQASVLFQLGTRTGAGNNQVAASSPGFVGQVVFSATATVGPPVRITADAVMGESFRGAAGSTLPAPFVAMVFDAGGNPVAGVPVTFTVSLGEGRLEGDQTSVTRNTDSDGKAHASFTLGGEPGVNNNVVTASFEGLGESPVTFTATALPSGAAAQTRVSGVVLDNANTPIPNAHARIEGTSLEAFSDAQGQFTITGAPVGTVLLEVDGATSTRPETFPMLAFHLTTVAGQDNTVGMPIYLPPLDTEGSRVAGGDEAVTLSMAGVPGVAFTIAPRSVTFKDGSRVGRVILSQVHADKVPMPPPFGTAPRVMWTLQPPGAHFDPPIRVQLPNVDHMPPGQVLEIFQFDHDLEQFVSVGAGRVSEDGSVIISDPGFGVTKSGWGGAPPPPPPKKDVCGCGACKTCALGVCVPNPGANGDSCNDPCVVNGRCTVFGTCSGDQKEITRVEAKAGGKDELTKPVDKPISFSVDVSQNNCTTLSYRWDFGDGSSSSDENPTHSYDRTGTFRVRVTVSCDSCTRADKNDTVEVKIFRLEIVEPAANTNYDITGASPPAMPRIRARARIVGIDPDPTDTTSFEWTARITYGGRPCPFEPPARVSIDFNETLVGGGFDRQFDTVRGGGLVLIAKATIEGEMAEDRTDRARMPLELMIRGTNPQRADVQAGLPHDTLRRMACQESRQRQFNAPPNGGVSECPLWSSDGQFGVGIMQITVPAPTPDQVWDWVLNLVGGLAIFNSKIQSPYGPLVSYPNQVRNSAGFAALVNAFNQQRATQGLPPVDVRVPAFTVAGANAPDFNAAPANLGQIELDAIRGYNGFGGRDQFDIPLHEFKIAQDANQLLQVVNVRQEGGVLVGDAVWARVPAADRPQTFGEPNYVNLVLGQSPQCP
jgi:hypothetical protein